MSIHRRNLNAFPSIPIDTHTTIRTVVLENTKENSECINHTQPRPQKRRCLERPNGDGGHGDDGSCKRCEARIPMKIAGRIYFLRGRVQAIDVLVVRRLEC